jgi:hypothetical protein
MRILTRFILSVVALIFLLLIVAWGFLIPLHLRDNVYSSISNVEKLLNVKIVYDSIGYIPFTTSVTIEEVAVKPDDSFIVLFSSRKVIVNIDIIGALFKDDIAEYISLKMIEPVLVINFGSKVGSFSFEGSGRDGSVKFCQSGSISLFNSNGDFYPLSDCVYGSSNNSAICLARVDDIVGNSSKDKMTLNKIPEMIIKNGKVLIQKDNTLLVLLDNVNGRLGKRTHIVAKVFGKSDCKIDGSIMNEITLSDTEVDTDVLKKVVFGEINTIFYKSSSIVSGNWKVGADFKLLINIKGGEVHTGQSGKVFVIEGAGLILDNKNLTVSNASLSYKGATFSVSGFVGLKDRMVDITANSPGIDVNLLAPLFFGKGIPNIKLPDLGSILIKIEGTIDKPVYRISYEKGE